MSDGPIAADSDGSNCRAQVESIEVDDGQLRMPGTQCVQRIVKYASWHLLPIIHNCKESLRHVARL